MFQRKQALLEQRQRIQSAARRMCWTEVIKNDFKISVHVEYNSNSEYQQVHEVQAWIENLVNDMIFDSMDCNVISDQLYEAIAEHYPGRNIEITVSTKNSGITIFYKTHRPIQKLAI